MNAVASFNASLPGMCRAGTGSLRADEGQQEPAAPAADSAGKLQCSPAIRDGVIQNLVSQFRGDYLLGRLMLEEGRFMVFQAILCLSAAQNPADRESWLTLGRLQSRLSTSGLTSRNRIEALVAIFERYGFIERRKAEEDLRISILTPTARMWSADALFTEMHLAPLCDQRDAQQQDSGRYADGAAQLLTRLRHAAEPANGLHQHADPMAPAWTERSIAPATAGHRNWRKGFARLLPDFFGMRMQHRSISALAERDGGYLTFLMLLHEAVKSGSNRIQMGYETISEHAGISRTHARLLMEQAEALELVKLHARGGRDIEVRQQSWDAMDSWLAGNFAYLLATG
jgi:DNA-binding MarR family transcriptional regulator